jgi:hypothetical protein
MNCAIDLHPPVSKTLRRIARPPLTATFAWVAAFCIALSIAGTSRTCQAEDAPSIVGYGFEGLGTGASIGLGIGYLSHGPEWDSGDWKNLVYGGAIGALAGLGVGILLGVVDAGTSRGRGFGFYMLRDSNYGVAVGFVAGGIIGLLQWMGDDGRAKDLLYGFAWGTVIGGGAGFIVGVIEGALRSGNSSSGDPATSDPAYSKRMRFGVAFAPNERGGVGAPYPTISGRF